MTYRLPRVLSPTVFPRAELDALRLDGQVFRLDDCAVSIDEVPGVPLRAQVVAAEVPPGLIAEQLSATWIWGAVPEPPLVHQLCADLSARVRPPLERRLHVREVVIGPEDFVLVSGLAVTAPLRTGIDLARFVPEWDERYARVVGALMALGRFSAVDCARTMNRRAKLPNKRRALERLAFSDSPELMPT